MAAALMDDAIMEILLRLRPDDTACIARASLVSKLWRQLLADRAFLRQYRHIHGAPPVLGFLYNSYTIRAPGVQFVHTSPASPFSLSSSSAGSLTSCRILDCRHGRVLLHQDGYPPGLIVWDPVIGKWCLFCAPLDPLLHLEFTAAVLCASNGCDHLDCSSGSFLVVLVQKTYLEHDTPWSLHVEVAQASLYSSETGQWSVSDSIYHRSFAPWGTARSLFTGDTVFFMVGVAEILKYDMAKRRLSVIRMPLQLVPNKTLCHAEDGGLGVAALEGYTTLRLFFLRTNPDGITEWERGKVVELDSVICNSIIGDPYTTFYVVGFAEGTNYIFVSANNSIFSVELKSNRISKIGSGKIGIGPIFPFMHFYIPRTTSPLT